MTVTCPTCYRRQLRLISIVVLIGPSKCSFCTWYFLDWLLPRLTPTAPTLQPVGTLLGAVLIYHISIPQASIDDLSQSIEASNFCKLGHCKCSDGYRLGVVEYGTRVMVHLVKNMFTSAQRSSASSNSSWLSISSNTIIIETYMYVAELLCCRHDLGI